MTWSILRVNFVVMETEANIKTMKTKETIAIIGATENMGSAIARKLSDYNYRLVLTSKDAEKLGALKNSLSTASVKAIVDTNTCEKNASWEAGIIIMACPREAEKQIAGKIREVATGKLVIRTPMPLDKSHRDLTTAPDTDATERLQELLPYSKIVIAHTTKVIPEILAATGLHPIAVD